MIDLEGWLGERYAIPGDPVPEEIPGEEEGGGAGRRPAAPRGRA